MTVLVTGGAGFVGSVVVDRLVERQESVVVVDNLSRSPGLDLPDGVLLVRCDVGDAAGLGEVLDHYRVDACIHLAGLIAVGESSDNPGLYLEHNVAQTVLLLRSLLARDVRQVVFSSSAAVYGDGAAMPVLESSELRPASPYGWTKMVVEQMLAMQDGADKLRSVSLRYFNAAGATPRRQERHDPETHLIPLAVAAALGGAPLTVFGQRYPTPDGTAVRDYVHVQDLADAHVLALDYLRAGGKTTQMNLGAGSGSSVLDVIGVVERIVGTPVDRSMGRRRKGDPPTLVASCRLARERLGWQPRFSTLETIIESVVEFGDMPATTRRHTPGPLVQALRRRYQCDEY